MAGLGLKKQEGLTSRDALPPAVAVAPTDGLVRLGVVYNSHLNHASDVVESTSCAKSIWD